MDILCSSSCHVTRYLTCSRNILFTTNCYVTAGNFVHSGPEMALVFGSMRFTTLYLGGLDLNQETELPSYIAVVVPQICCFYGSKNLFCKRFIPQRYALHLRFMTNHYPLHEQSVEPRSSMWGAVRRLLGS
jgi:hypothetical protein